MDTCNAMNEGAGFPALDTAPEQSELTEAAEAARQRRLAIARVVAATLDVAAQTAEHGFPDTP